jgi:AcrR family transcriptional regulator
VRRFGAKREGAMNTKEKILREALSLFSVRGFDAVSVRDIAQAVGIKESSLYNHFKSKQDIFDSILAEYSGSVTDFFSRFSITDDGGQFAVDKRIIDMYKDMTPRQFEAMSIEVFRYYFTDEINVKLRRMLTMEQYRNEAIAKLFRQISFDSSIEYQSKLFEALMDAGVFARCDPYVLAVEFFAPVFMISYKFDNDADSLKEAEELFIRHIKHFNEMYTNTANSRENNK